MQAKDTVIEDIKIHINAPDWVQILSKGELNLCVRPLLETQAEISFKAGIKEVVEWVNDNSEYFECEGSCDSDRHIIDKKWQAKLREWEEYHETKQNQKAREASPQGSKDTVVEKL